MIDSAKGGYSILTMNLLDGYYTRLEVGCQVNFNDGFARIFTDLVATENTEGTERRLETLAQFTAEIAETAEERRGMEIRLRGCLAGDAGAETRNPKYDPSALLRTRIRNKFKMRMLK